jgi:hypothetical protein
VKLADVAHDADVAFAELEGADVAHADMADAELEAELYCR